jgi:hypothetical protein
LGLYNIYDHVIFLANAQGIEELIKRAFSSEEEYENALTHESFHAIAGKTIVQEADREAAYLDFPISNQPRIVKQGLAFLFSRQKEAGMKRPFNRRFGWLDEAVTESEALTVLNKKERIVREKEIRLYELLRKKGKFELPRELFIDAYTEDYDLTAPPGDRLPNWKKLRGAINHAYDRRFLIELDDFILANRYTGLEAAIKFMEGFEPGEYTQLGNTLQEVRKTRALKLGIKINSSWDDVERVSRAVTLGLSYESTWDEIMQFAMKKFDISAINAS